MSVIFQAVMHMFLRHKRTCLKCHREQLVPLGKNREIVNCKFCGERMPPTRD